MNITIATRSDKIHAGRIRLTELPAKLRLAKKQIETASGYESELRHGTGCDSSNDSAFRMEYVRKAETDFLNAHKPEILKLAASYVAKDIEELQRALTGETA